MHSTNDQKKEKNRQFETEIEKRAAIVARQPAREWPGAAGRHVISTSWLFARFAGRCSVVYDGAILNISNLLTMHFPGPPIISQFVW